MMQGVCRFCGESGEGEKFNAWVKPTFTDFDKLMSGEIVCEACLFYFQESSEELARTVGKEKPQRMRNYSHFIKAGQWTPLSKGNKQAMQDSLLTPPFPELAAIAESGQKHIVFRATRNPSGQRAGWVQFEEQSLYVDPAEFKILLGDVESLYSVFSKSEIATGAYNQYRVMQFGVAEWQVLEQRIKSQRQSILFALALFLAQKREEAHEPIGAEGLGSRASSVALARGAKRPKKQVSDEHLGAIREQHPKRGVHEQFGKVRQLTLFEDGE